MLYGHSESSGVLYGNHINIVSVLNLKKPQMEDKKKFLLDLAKIHDALTTQTENECIRRFLAFKVVLVAMSFEDLVNVRKYPSARKIRDVFLAHTQSSDFFAAFDASEEICKDKIDELISAMEAEMNEAYVPAPELTDTTLFRNITAILEKFHEDFYSGFRLSNNFLCTGEGQIKEISSNPIASVFYRYNSSRELSSFANYFISNLSQFSLSRLMLNSFKIDYILHAVNMCDTIFKDKNNRNSIDGLHEVIQREGIGNIEPLNKLKGEQPFWTLYKELRWLRNKLAGHMDKKEKLTDLMAKLEALNFQKAFDFVNELDKAVRQTSISHIVLRIHYYSFNQRIEDQNIIAMGEFKNRPYFEGKS